MYNRFCQQKILNILQDTPVVFIAGPRQCGKTTLVNAIKKPDWQYITFDDITQLEIAQKDPINFIRHLTADHVILDEIQRVPALFLAIKQSVDQRRQAGRFLLTGSANALLLPELADALTGRLETINLLPLTQCEITAISATFFPALLAGELPVVKQTRIRDTLIQRVASGGFPEPLTRANSTRRNAWFVQYSNNIVQKDIKALAEFEHLDIMPRLIRTLCHHSGQLINYTELAGRIGLSRQTMVRYVKLLEQLFIFESLPAWHRNYGKRMTRTPKMHIIDSGLLCGLTNMDEKKLAQAPEKLGHLVETYVYCELRRLATWLEEPLYFYHYRDKDKVEVDVVIETAAGGVFGIEIKAGATLTEKDFQGLQRLKKLAGDDFQMGVILYDGDHSAAFGDKLYALPLGAIWQ